MQIILNSIYSIHWGCRWRRNVILPIIRHCNCHKVFEYFVIIVSEFENCSFLNITTYLLVLNRKWNIKILQYSCSYENLAPAGCLQYFYGMGATGSVSSFNYEGGIHLANQDQKVCVRCDFFMWNQSTTNWSYFAIRRRESGKCSICWSHATGDFDISYAAAADMGHNAKSVIWFFKNKQ